MLKKKINISGGSSKLAFNIGRRFLIRRIIKKIRNCNENNTNKNKKL